MRYLARRLLATSPALPYRAPFAFEDSSNSRYGARLRLRKSLSDSKGRRAAAYYNRGLAYARSQDHVRAIEDYDRAVELNPKSPAAYNNRGLVYARSQDYARAIEDFRRAIEVQQIRSHVHLSGHIVNGASADEARRLFMSISPYIKFLYAGFELPSVGLRAVKWEADDDHICAIQVMAEK